MKLRLKFNLVLTIIFLIGLTISGFVSYQLLQENARKEVVRNAGLMMATALAIRGYTVNNVKPLLADKLKDNFLPETVPAFAATETLNDLRKSYPNYSYKEAVLNPTNSRNLAVGWEMGLVGQFKQQSGTKEIIGERDSPNGPILYIARPITISNPACLQCHSLPEAAPASMIKLYGRENGFGWKHKEIVGTQLVQVPMSLPLKNAMDAFYSFMGSLLGIFMFVFTALNLMLGRVVIKPIAEMSRAADRISLGDFSAAEFPAQGKDEVAMLATSFNRMRRSLETAMKMIKS